MNMGIRGLMLAPEEPSLSDGSDKFRGMKLEACDLWAEGRGEAGGITGPETEGTVFFTPLCMV